jgi:hypothetical protein
MHLDTNNEKNATEYSGKRTDCEQKRAESQRQECAER